MLETTAYHSTLEYTYSVYLLSKGNTKGIAYSVYLLSILNTGFPRILKQRTRRP